MTTPTPALRERKRLERRAHILSSSRRLFDRDGFEATSMESIAAVVDVSVGTIYKFFPTKIDILSALLREDLESNMADTPRVTTTNVPEPREGIYRLLEQEHRALEKLPKNYLSLVTAHALATGQTTETGRLFAETDEYLRSEVHSLLAAYQEKDTILPGADIELMSSLIYSVANGEHFAWLAGELTSIDLVLARLREFLVVIFAGIEALSPIARNPASVAGRI